MSPVELLTSLSEAHFTQVVAASPKKFREELFRRAGIKSRGGGAFSISNAKKNEVRIQRLFKALQAQPLVSPEVAEEVIRNYLYQRRDLLAQALDFFEVEHDHGLTDDALDFLDSLTPEKADALRKELLDKHEERDVELYLRFMGIDAGV